MHNQVDQIPNPSKQSSSVVEREVLDSLVSFSGAKVLEVGGGDGRLTKQFASDETQAVVIDHAIIELAKASEDLSASHANNVALHRARAEHLPYRDESFDLVVFSWSL